MIDQQLKPEEEVQLGKVNLHICGGARQSWLVQCNDKDATNLEQSALRDTRKQRTISAV